MQLTERQREMLKKFKRSEDKAYAIPDRFDVPPPTVDKTGVAPKTRAEQLIELAKKCNEIIRRGGIEKVREELYGGNPKEANLP
jgi:hypothetical protein